MLWLGVPYFSEEKRDGVGWGYEEGTSRGEGLGGKARRRGHFDWIGYLLIDQLIDNKNCKL